MTAATDTTTPTTEPTEAATAVDAASSAPEAAGDTITTVINQNAAADAAVVTDTASQLVTTYAGALLSPNSYIELLAIGIAVGAGVLAALLLRTIIRRRFGEIMNSENWGWLLRPLNLLLPVCVLVMLSAAKPLVLPYVDTTLFFYPATQIVMVWLLVLSVHILVHWKMMAWFISTVIAIIVALQTFGLLHPMAQLLRNISVQIGDNNITVLGVLQGMVICVLVFWLAFASSSRIEKQLRTSKFSYNIRELIIKFSKILIYSIAFFVTLSAVGVNLTAFAVFGGALGVGIGLGLQKITSNFVSGITLLMEKSVRQGDLIKVGDIHGYVRELNIRYTLVETFSGQEVSIPNETLTSSNIINWTMHNPRARIEIQLGVAYGSDYRLVQQLLVQAAEEHPRCLKTPEVVCHLRSFSDFSVEFLLQFWVGNVVDGLYAPQSDVMLRIAELFHEHDIEIPFPRRDIRILPETTSASDDLPSAEDKGKEH